MNFLKNVEFSNISNCFWNFEISLIQPSVGNEWCEISKQTLSALTFTTLVHAGVESASKWLKKYLRKVTPKVQQYVPELNYFEQYVYLRKVHHLWHIQLGGAAKVKLMLCIEIMKATKVCIISSTLYNRAYNTAAFKHKQWR